MLAFVRELKEELGLRLYFVDLGGGLGIPFRDGQTVMTPEDLAKALKPIWEEEVAPLGYEPELWIEPGRFLVAQSGFLVARVNSVKTTPVKTFVNVDAGFNTLMRPALYGAYHRVRVVGRTAAPMTLDVAGDVCETGDILAEERLLPRPEAGDLVVFLDAGAYGFAMASEYNARPLPAEVLVDGDDGPRHPPPRDVRGAPPGRAGRGGRQLRSPPFSPADAGPRPSGPRPRPFRSTGRGPRRERGHRPGRRGPILSCSAHNRIPGRRDVMTRRLWFSLWTSLLVLPLLSAPPAAALSREVPLDEVFTRGEAVFVGTVVSTRAVWGEGKKMIWTEYTFAVRETWKGEGARRQGRPRRGRNARRAGRSSSPTSRASRSAGPTSSRRTATTTSTPLPSSGPSRGCSGR